MKKRFKTRRRSKKRKTFRAISYLIIFISVCIFTIYKLEQVDLKMNNEEFLRSLIYHSNHNISYNYDKKNTVTKMIKFFGKFSLEKPNTILDNTYAGLVDTPMIDSDVNVDLDDLEDKSSYIKDPFPENKSTNPIVYIYNTHQLENYNASNLQEYNIQPNVMMGSYILREKLNNLGIPAMVEEGNVPELLRINGWNYASSYKVTKMFMEDAKEKHESIQYFVDFHRDSVGRNVTTKVHNDKTYARMLFIVGLENEGYEANLKLATALHNKLEEKVPGISRGIYKKEGPGVDGVYNQDVSGNAILLEMGGVDNTIEEVLNSTEIFAEALYDYIGEQK